MRKGEVKAAINAAKSSNPPSNKLILCSDSFLRSFLKTNLADLKTNWAEKIEEGAQQKGEDEEAEVSVTVAQ